MPYVIPEPPDAAAFEFISSLWFRLMPPLPMAFAFWVIPGELLYPISGTLLDKYC